MLTLLRKNAVPYLTTLTFCAMLVGCSHSTTPTPTPTPSPVVANNPVPTVTTLAPTTSLVGAASQTLTITGTNFISASTVTYNGTAHTATYVSATQLTISLAAADQASAGSFPVIVTNPTPGGGSSTAVNLTVNNPAPTVNAISPAKVLVGAAAQTLTITGTNFFAATTVTFGGVAVTPMLVSGTQLTIPLTAANQATIGSFPIVVTNPAPGGGSASEINFTVAGSVVNGVVYKGASVGSTVTGYEVNADGSNGTALGTATTDAAGAFSLALSALPPGALRLTATGGNYKSEFDGTTVTGTSSVSALLDSVTTPVSGVAITPVSEFVNSYTTQLLSSKTVATEAAAHAEAAGLIGGYLSLSKAAVIELLVPVFDKPDITANTDAFKVGLFIGAMATEGHTVSPSSPDDLIGALSADISDGLFDGKAAGVPVPLATAVESTIRIRHSVAIGRASAAAAATPVGLSATAGTTDYLSGLGTYITTGTAVTGAGIKPPDVAALESAMFAGVAACTCTPAAVGLTASSSGATTTYSVGGHQYLIVAARGEGVVIADITDPTNKTPAINAWPSISASTLSGAEVGGVIVITGLAGHPQVLAYAYDSTTITVLNLNTLISGNPATDNPVDLTTTLTLAATSPVGFSGGRAYIAGGIPDSGRGGVWLDTADGYGLLSLSSLVAGTTSVSLSNLYPVSDTSEAIAENVGGDIGNNQLIGGNYGGVQLVDLAKNKSYYLQSSLMSPTLTGFQSGFFIDGNSVDSNLRVAILTTEDGRVAGFLNLATATETDASPTAAGALNALAPTAGGLVQVNLGTTGGYNGHGPVLSGSAVDKKSHLALFMAGYSNDIAVGQVQDPTTVAAGAAWTGMTDWTYFTLSNSAELSGYIYATDPHSVGVVVNQTTGTPFGYLFDGSTDHGIVQVDLANFLAMPRSGTIDDAAHQPAGDPGATTTAAGGLVLQEFVWADPTKPIAAAKQKSTQQDFPNQPMVTPKK